LRLHDNLIPKTYKDEPVNLRNNPVEQDLAKLIKRFRGIQRIYLKLIIKKPESSCNMQPIGLGKNRFLIDFAKKSPWIISQI
jgi:hypothetical protein